MFRNKEGLALDLVIRALIEKAHGTVMLPEKTVQIFDQETQNRINCLPGTLLTQKVSGVKWVSVFPTNPQKGLQNVTGVIVLSSIETGYPLAIVDGAYCTALRTAAAGAVAVKYLAREDSRTIGFIGAGEQARMHFRLIKAVRDVKECFVASRTELSENEFVGQLKEEYPDVCFVACKGDYEKATASADIIVTAVSCQQPLLKAEYVNKGTTYIHVGGWEDEYDVAKKADKIVCDDWESVKHRSQTISRMYHQGLLNDDSIYGNLDQIIVGNLPGREREQEIIYFNSVGLAIIDLMFAYEVYRQSKAEGYGVDYRMQGNSAL